MERKKKKPQKKLQINFVRVETKHSRFAVAVMHERKVLFLVVCGQRSMLALLSTPAMLLHLVWVFAQHVSVF